VAIETKTVENLVICSSVQKKDGTWWICIYYKELNKITVRNRYPIPYIDYLLSQLKGEKFFNNIDLNYGYHQVPIEPIDV
jgi:hypothetical protein